MNGDQNTHSHTHSHTHIYIYISIEAAALAVHNSASANQPRCHMSSSRKIQTPRSFCLFCIYMQYFSTPPPINLSHQSTAKQQRKKTMAFFRCSTNALIFIFPLFLTASSLVSGSNYFQDFDLTWGDGRGQILNNGDLLTLSLDSHSGSGFQSKHQYLFGKIDMQLKLVPGNSAGTVTALYLSSDGPNHDEIDFEFLGNLSGEPYTVHTNVYTQGKGEKEQQFRLWFDPTADFHTYSVHWNPQTIVFSVDGTPLREFKNLENAGVPFPKQQPMKIYSSIWNADEWATRGGLIKTDWSQAPFTAAYRNFNADACAVGGGDAVAYCSAKEGDSSPWRPEKLDPYSEEKLKWVQQNYMIYNYCNDANRFPQGFPTECNT